MPVLPVGPRLCEQRRAVRQLDRLSFLRETEQDLGRQFERRENQQPRGTPIVDPQSVAADQQLALRVGSDEHAVARPRQRLAGLDGHDRHGAIAIPRRPRAGRDRGHSHQHVVDPAFARPLRRKADQLEARPGPLDHGMHNRHARRFQFLPHHVVVLHAQQRELHDGRIEVVGHVPGVAVKQSPGLVHQALMRVVGKAVRGLPLQRRVAEVDLHLALGPGRTGLLVNRILSRFHRRGERAHARQDLSSGH